MQPKIINPSTKPSETKSVEVPTEISPKIINPAIKPLETKSIEVPNPAEISRKIEENLKILSRKRKDAIKELDVFERVADPDVYTPTGYQETIKEKQEYIDKLGKMIDNILNDPETKKYLK